MFHIVLYQPEIPPNTGNAMRLSANTGCRLHLIEPLGFSMDDASLRRAGMDYREKAVVTLYPDTGDFLERVSPGRLFALAKSGSTVYSDIAFEEGDALLFGPESAGLPDEILEAEWVTGVLKIPMQPGLRSLNLSNSVAIVVYEAWRQRGFRI